MDIGNINTIHEITTVDDLNDNAEAFEVDMPETEKVEVATEKEENETVDA